MTNSLLGGIRPLCFEDMVLLMHAEVEKDDSKDTFACNDDAHKADMGPENPVLR